MLDTAGNISIETKASDKALWLAVTAAPSEMQTILWDQFYYSVYRYPYMIEVVNGKPEGYNDNFWKPAGYAGGSAQGYAKHANGGGWVSSKAKVDASVYVGPDAVVNGGTVTGDARIEDFAVVNGGTVGGKAVVRGRALVSGGSMADNAILEEDAWLVSGTLKDDVRVGALSVITNSTVSGKAQVHGVMWPVDGKKLSGTAQLRGDLENNFTSEISKGVFYGMVNTDMLNNVNFGANLTEPPTDATADFAGAIWYALAEDSLVEDSSHMVSWRAPALASAKDEVVLDIFDLNGKWLGRTRSLGCSTPSDYRFLLKKGNFPAGMYFVRDAGTHRVTRVNLGEF